MSIGLVLLAGGTVATAAGCAGTVALLDSGFPLARLVVLLLALASVVTAVAALRGLVALVQGLTGYARTRRR